MGTVEEGTESQTTNVDPNSQASVTSLEPIAPANSNPASTSDIPLGANESSTHNQNPELQEYRDACQSGDLAKVKEMVELGLIDITHDYHEDEMVSGLHWASINNRLGVAKYLVGKGADVNFKGGNLKATPLHWAARYGYVYIVDFLLESGADPTLTDHQGFNLLHLSINSSNIMLVLYVLFFVVGDKISIDCVDPDNRTPILWAAYQGDSLSVKALLDFKADFRIADNGGFTPLHWATVKGQPQVLKHLIENGGDFLQNTNDNKNCFVISQEMRTEHSLTNALLESGFNAEGVPIIKLFKNPQHAKLLTFVTPWILVGLILKIMATLNTFVAITFTVLIGWASTKILKKFVIPSYSLRQGGNAFLKTPFLAGLLFGSVIWVFYVWLTRVLPATVFDEPLANALFFVFLTVCLGLFGSLVLSDPGRITKEQELEPVRIAIKELLRIGKFDTRHFCVDTYKRKPLRSKFSRFNEALIVRFDHFCPWIYNDVGLLNHKQFIYFLLSLVSGVSCFFIACIEYFDFLEDESKTDFKCGIFDDEICAGFHLDTFAFLVLSWTLIQAVWVFFLIAVQLFQTFKGITNQELNSASRKRHARDSGNEFFTTTPTDLMDAEDLEALNQPALDSEEASQLKPRTCGGVCFGLIGLDQIVLVVKGFFGGSRNLQLSHRPSHLSFETNYGWRTNLKDFWLLSDTTAPLWQRLLYSQRGFKALLGGTEVDYQKLYTLPSPRFLADEMV